MTGEGVSPDFNIIVAISIPPEISVQFHAERRRSRLKRLFLWAPVIFIVASAASAGFLAWRGHGLIYFLSKVKPSFVGQDSVFMFWLLVCSAFGGLSVLMLLVVAASFGKSGVIELPYCTRCHVADETNRGRCETCGAELEEKREVLYPDFFDDSKLLRAFGLNE